MKFNKVQTIIILSGILCIFTILIGSRFFLAYFESTNEFFFRYLPKGDPINAYRYFYQGNAEFMKTENSHSAQESLDQINHSIESYTQSYTLLPKDETLFNLEAAKKKKAELEMKTSKWEATKPQNEWEKNNESSPNKDEKKNQKKGDTWDIDSKTEQEGNKSKDTTSSGSAQWWEKKDTTRNNEVEKSQENTWKKGTLWDSQADWGEEGKKESSNEDTANIEESKSKNRTGFTNSGALKQVGKWSGLIGSNEQLSPEDTKAILEKRAELEDLQNEKNTYIRPNGKIDINWDIGSMFEQFFGRSVITSPGNDDPEDY